MSYSEAQEAARIGMMSGYCTVPSLIREILSDAPDEVMKSIAEDAEIADSLVKPCMSHQDACLRVGKTVIGLIHKYLSENQPTEWMDGTDDSDPDSRFMDDHKSISAEMAKLSRLSREPL